MRVLVENLVEARAPSNVPLVNPASAKTAIDTGGLSLVRAGAARPGPRHGAPDPRDGRPRLRGRRQLAATPGAVVLRTELFELIQYTPQTEEVREVPVLLVPPTINKYYVLDLAPDRSLIEYRVRQGGRCS